MADGTWSVAEAKARFSELVEKARTEGPQLVTRNGKDAAVVVSAAAWANRDAPKESLADLLARSPLRGSGVRIERMKEKMRDVDF